MSESVDESHIIELLVLLMSVSICCFVACVKNLQKNIFFYLRVQNHDGFTNETILNEEYHEKSG